MNLTAENYFSQEANLEYMSCSQFKSFCECEDRTLAELSGDYRQPTNTALLVGSYVDAHYEGTLDIFKAQHPEIFKRDGTLKAEYLQAEAIINRTESDKMFSKYMSGQKQVIMTGNIAGIPFKIKIDSYHPGKAIVDLKIVKDFEKIWDNKRHIKVPFVEYWGYDIQGAIYQEIVRQNTGCKLPFLIAAATKESETDICIMNIPQGRLDECLAYVEQRAPMFDTIKKGEVTSDRCEKCAWCKRTKILTEIIDYRDLEV